MTDSEVSEIKHAIRRVKNAKQDLTDLVCAVFPVGSEIEWERSGRQQRGKVTVQGSRGDLRVRNDRTGKEYWIGMYDVVGYVA